MARPLQRRVEVQVRRNYSSRGSIIILQHAAQSLPALNRASVCEVVRFRFDQAISQSLMVAFKMIMDHEVLNGRPQRTFPEQDQPFQTGFLDAADEPLRVGVGMSLRMRRMATLRSDFSE